MILSFGFKNFLSFKEGFECSFVDGKNIQNLMCVVGANGAGKSNILKGLAFFMRFVSDSYSFNNSDSTEVLPFYNSSNDTVFFIDFIIDKNQDCIYSYELHLNRQKIVKELLYRKIKRKQMIVKREFGKIKQAVGEFEELKSLNLRNNVSFISSAKQDVKESIFEIHDFFSNCLFNVSLHYNLSARHLMCGFAAYKHDLYETTKIYSKNENIFKQICDFIKECDIGISDIKIEKRLNENGEEVYAPYFLHKVDGEYISLPYNSESEGTKFLYMHFPHLVFMKGTGSVVIFDEIDMSLHPHIVCKMIKYAINSDMAGQLIFSLHSFEALELLKASQIFVINKKDNESFGYLADEIPALRKDRSLMSAYLQGKIGGIPNL